MSYLIGIVFLVACWLVKRRFDAVEEFAAAKGRDLFALKGDLAIANNNLDAVRQSHRHRLDSLESRMKNHDKASGGFHLCRDKSLVRLRDMSDAYLRHVLHEVQGLEAAAVCSGLLRDELERRKRADLYRQSEDVLGRMRASAALKQVENVSKTLGLRKRQILLQSLEILQKWADSK